MDGACACGLLYRNGLLDKHGTHINHLFDSTCTPQAHHIKNRESLTVRGLCMDGASNRRSSEPCVLLPLPLSHKRDKQRTYTGASGLCARGGAPVVPDGDAHLQQNRGPIQPRQVRACVCVCATERERLCVCCLLGGTGCSQLCSFDARTRQVPLSHLHPWNNRFLRADPFSDFSWCVHDNFPSCLRDACRLSWLLDTL